MSSVSNQTSRIIGLTSGIACGKSTAAQYLEKHHPCIILDADHYARDAVSPQSPILQMIQHRHGDRIIDHQGELKRQMLGNIIFNNEQERQWLDNLIHPYVRQRLEQERNQYLKQIQSSSKLENILVMVIPLLFESKMDDLVTEIWVISCSPIQQQQRLMERNSLSLEQAKARIQSQWPLKDKIKRASVILNNSGDRNQLYQQIDAAIQRKT